MARAIELVQTSRDDELWGLLLDHAMGSPHLIDALLAHVCSEPLMQLESLTLVRRLPLSTPIPSLKKRLVQILAQASNQLELTQGCFEVAHADCVSLMRARHRQLRRGIVWEPGSGAADLAGGR